MDALTFLDRTTNPRCRVRTGLEPVRPPWLGHTQEESDGEKNFLLRVRALLPHHTTTGSGLLAEREGNDASVDLVSASSPLMSFKLRLNMNSRAVPIALAWMH
jgi:hypothetical protein